MRALAVVGTVASLSGSAFGGVLQYGDQDVLGTGSYGADPTAGATLEGLAPGAITFGGPEVNHGFPFSPEGDDFPGTDQIYVGSAQSGFQDGYSQFAGRLAGPQVIVMDYGSLVPAGETVVDLTLGIAFDDFQNVSFGQPYSVSINGVAVASLTNLANSLDQTFPQVQFASIGIDPALLLGSNLLTLSVDQGGNGGDGWAIDFLTIGVTTIPAPSSAAVMVFTPGFVSRRRR